jgi:hypothetical protein
LRLPDRVGLSPAHPIPEPEETAKRQQISTYIRFFARRREAAARSNVARCPDRKAVGRGDGHTGSGTFACLMNQGAAMMGDFDLAIVEVVGWGGIERGAAVLRSDSAWCCDPVR